MKNKTPPYNPIDWYWLVAGNNAQVFCSARSSYVSTNDSMYQAWVAAGHRVTPIASESDLVKVLEDQAPQVVVPSIAGLTSYAQKKQQQVASAGITVNVGTVASPVNVKVSTDTASLVLLEGAARRASSDPSFSTKWVQEDGTSIDLNAAQVLIVDDVVTTFLQQTFSTLSAVISAISDHTIGSKESIDMPAAPLPAWPKNS